MSRSVPFLLASWLGAQAQAQPVLFDIDNAPLFSALPLDLTVDGITAHLSATSQGFSIQLANALGFTPAGFGGNCVYPSSVYAADLLISFSAPMTGFSILYAPEEYACDSSATMRVTAYLDSTWIGTATTNAVAGTWPSEILQITTARPFNRVVVHYDQPPATGGDWGPIFMADNMTVIAAPPPLVLQNPVLLPNGIVKLYFTHLPGGTYSIWATSDPATPSANWSLLGAPAEVSPGHYQFDDLLAPGNSQRFYCVQSP